MQPIIRWITIALVVAGAIYALSPGPQHFMANPDGWEFREQFVFLTGVSTLSLMVLSMVISVRIPWVNHQMRGLDKAYVVHKWTGICATLLLVFHWLGEKVPGWLVAWGFIPNPGDLDDGSDFSDLEIGLFQSGVIGVEFFVYVIITLVIIALVQKIPYHFFRKSHKVFPFVFLVAAYHGATAQLKERWLTTPGGYLLLVLVAIGVVAALIGLSQRIGASRTATATISQITHHEHGILDLRLTTTRNFFFHQPGQYAFLRFAHDREPHPFTIASVGDNPRTLRFAIKSLGDFTGDLPGRLRVGQPVTVEGPYGEFQFESPETRQIWIAGGIGITPFMARLEHLAHHGGTRQPVDFWYSTRGNKHSLFPDSLEGLCQQSGVELHHLDSTRKEYLTAAMLHEVVGSFQNVSIWFCGPPAFGQCLLKGLTTYGFDKRCFHYDDFAMR